MNNRQARLFAIGATALTAVAFLGMTWDTHRQVAELTNAKDITPEVSHGMDVWHKYNCINCHTLFGEGAYYAPDLTKITDHRGRPYLEAYMKDPSKFYDEQIHRRLMPNQNLETKEIADLVSFLQWVANVDNQGWPPRPIMVTGGIPGTVPAETASADSSGASTEALTGITPTDATDDPRAQGQNVFRTAAPACVACHSVSPGVNMAGPSLAGLGTKAAATVSSAEYTGSASDAEGYILESIIAPSAHVVPGGMYSADGNSFMPVGYADSLSEEQLDQLVAYLATLK